MTEIHPKPPAPPPSEPAEPESFAMLYAYMQRTAQDMGYALAMVIGKNETAQILATPWDAGAQSNMELVEALLYEASVRRLDAVMLCGAHGRRAWRIPLGGGQFVLLSVYPRHGIAEIS